VNPLSHLGAYAHLLRSRIPGARGPAGAASIRLPFNGSPTVATFLHTGFFLGILTADGPCDGLLNIYLQLSAPRRRTDFVNVLPLRFLPTIPPDLLGLTESRDWSAAEIARIGKGGLAGEVIGAMRGGEFLYANIDYFYLPGSAFYARRHFRQSALVVGFDAGAGEFTIACYLKSGLFGLARMPWRLLGEAFHSPLGRARCSEASKADRLNGIRRPAVAGPHAVLDLDAIRWQLADYLNATNEAPRRMANGAIREWCARHDTSTAADTYYGSGIHEGLIATLNATDPAAPGTFDFRITRLVWEHKKMMTLRLRRLSETGAIAIPGLDARWAEVEQAAWSLHFTLVRSASKRERIDRESVVRSVNDMAALERTILGEVLESLQKPET